MPGPLIRLIVLPIPEELIAPARKKVKYKPEAPARGLIFL